MIPLDSPVWSELQTAYGSAGDIPGLLKQIIDFPAVATYKDEPWFSLWSALCHQGDVYSASFAAVPHVVEALSKDPARASVDYFQLPVCIELARIENELDVPVELKHEYRRALERLPTLAATAACSDWTDDKCAVSLAAIAITTGKHELARLLIEVEPSSYPYVVEHILTG